MGTIASAAMALAMIAAFLLAAAGSSWRCARETASAAC